MFTVNYVRFIVLLNLIATTQCYEQTEKSHQIRVQRNSTTATVTPQFMLRQSETIDDPCKPFDAKTPNFTRPGLRVSDIKCAEYIWHLNYRAQKEKRSIDCAIYRSSHGGPNFAIGGRDTVPGEFPHMGAIGWQAFIGTWIFKCGSSLISSKFVLTAAHCTRASDRDTTVADPIPKIVRLGDKYIGDVGLIGVRPTDANIIQIIIHPSYKAPKKYNDIALMELDRDIEFTKLEQPACLWHHFDTSRLGHKATVTGWGVIDAAGLTSTPELQAADVDIIDSSQCDDLLNSMCNRHWCGLENTQICAGKLSGGVDSCRGDSGGPLQVQIPLPISSQGQMHYVIGITSFGFGCALENTPGIYTRVSSYIDWIESIVWPQK